MGESRTFLLAKISVEKSCKIQLAPQNAGPLFCKYFLKKQENFTDADGAPRSNRGHRLALLLWEGRGVARPGTEAPGGRGRVPRARF